MLFAVEAERKLGERGARGRQVCLMGEDGFFTAEWTNANPAEAPQAALA